jgi:hypothetical protein
MLRLGTWGVTVAVALAAAATLAVGSEDRGQGAGANAGGLVGHAAEAAGFAASEAAFGHSPGTPGYARVASLSALNLVQATISAPRFAELAESGDPPLTAADNWALQAGICGGASDAYEAVMAELGVPTRRLDLHWIDHNGVPNSHATVETQWGGEWHWTDPTWGAIFTPPGEPAEVLSFAQVRSERPKRLRVNEAGAWWLLQRKWGFDTLGFTEWPARKLLWGVVKRPSPEAPPEAAALEPLTVKEAMIPARSR